MKTQTFFISAMISLTLLTYGQLQTKKVKIQWGKPLEITRNTIKYAYPSYIGYDKKNFYFIATEVPRTVSIFFITSSTKVDEFLLQKYDNNLNIEKASVISLKNQGKRLDLEFVTHINDKLYLFTSYKNEEQKKHYLFFQTIDKTTLQLNNDIQKIAEIDYSTKSRYNAGNFNYIFSNDSSKILIYYNLPYDKNEEERFGLIMLNKQMQKLWEKEITIPYKDKAIGIFDQEVDNDGNVYLATMLDKKKAKQEIKDDNESQYKLVVIGCFDKAQDIKEYSIDIPDGTPIEADLFIHQNNDILCSGFYSDTKRTDRENKIIKGVFFAKIDGQKKTLTVLEHQPLKLEDVKDNIILPKLDNKYLQGYFINEYILKENGGVILVTEQNLIVEKITKNSMGMTVSSSTLYYRNDIMLISISPQGKIEWARKIPKYQGCNTPQILQFLSYGIAVVKDKIYILYNAHPEKYAKKRWRGKDVWIRAKPVIPILITLDFNGNKTREILYNLDEKNKWSFLISTHCKQFSSNEMVAPVVTKKEFKIAKITFTE